MAASNHFELLPFEIVQIILEQCPPYAMLACKLWYKLMLSGRKMARLRRFHDDLGAISEDEDMQTILALHHEKWCKYVNKEIDEIMWKYPTYVVNIDKHPDDLRITVRMMLSPSKFRPIYDIMGGQVWSYYYSEIHDIDGTCTDGTGSCPDELVSNIEKFCPEYKPIMSELIPVFIKIYNDAGM